MAATGKQWDHRWRTGAVLLAITAALVSAFGFVEPARADDAGTSGDAAATSENEAPAADQPTGTTEDPVPPAPEPAPAPEPPPAETPPPAPEPEPEPSVTTEPPAEEPVVTLEPEPVTPEPAACSESEAEACEAAAEDTATVESPPAEQTEPPAASSPPPSAPPAAQPPPAAPSEIVVSLAPAPNETATAPATDEAAEPVAALEGVSAEPSAAKNWAPLAEPPAVELASAPVRVARLVDGPFLVAPAVAWPAPPTMQGLSPAALTYIQRITGSPYATGSNQGARAGPTERDGAHREVEAAEAEPQSPSIAGGPRGLFDDQGLGASGGSAGGAPGNAASSRYFAIASTPERFAFPSAFAFAPLSSSVPEGALEAAPTTRPG